MSTTRKFWTAEQVALLTELYPTTRTLDLVPLLGRSERVIFQKANGLGLKKTAERLAEARRFKNGESNKATQFKKGHATWNAGMKGWQAGGKAKETQFKRGHKPHGWHPIGFERVSKDGYLQRKLTDTGVTRRDFVAVHHIVWREAGREIPSGHALIFKDGNKRNFDFSNLELVSRAELMRRNSIHRHGPEIAALHQLRGAVQRQINKRKKEQASAGSSREDHQPDTPAMAT